MLSRDDDLMSTDNRLSHSGNALHACSPGLVPGVRWTHPAGLISGEPV